MPLVGFCDIESTGVRVESDRICEFALVTQDLDTSAVRFKYERKIDPTVNIPAKLTLIHGIGNADVLGCPTFKQVALLLGNLFERLDYVIGHNFEDFDAQMLLHEFIRAGVVLKRFPVIIDTMKLGRGATADGKYPTLNELCWALDIPYDKALAHRALYDVEVNAQAWRRGIEIGVFNKPQHREIN